MKEKEGKNTKELKEGSRGQKFPHNTFLSTNRARILQKAMVAEIMLAPRKAITPKRAYQIKHCQYQKNHCHHTELIKVSTVNIKKIIATTQKNA